MAIHLVQRSHAYPACRNSAAVADVIVLLGEGVAALLTTQDPCLALNADVVERGLQDHLAPETQLIDDAELVRLCAIHSPCVSWTAP